MGWIYMYQTGLWEDPYITGSVRYWGNVFFYGNTNDLGKLMNHSARAGPEHARVVRSRHRLHGYWPDSRRLPGVRRPRCQSARHLSGAYGSTDGDRAAGGGPRDWDLRIQKTFDVAERLKIRVAGDAFNLTNHTQFGGPDLIPTDAAFGFVSVQRNVPRYIEFLLRIEF